MSPTEKNVALVQNSSSVSRIGPVTHGTGPSSKVNTTSPGARKLGFGGAARHVAIDRTGGGVDLDHTRNRQALRLVGAGRILRDSGRGEAEGGERDDEAHTRNSPFDGSDAHIREFAGARQPLAEQTKVKCFEPWRASHAAQMP